MTQPKLRFPQFSGDWEQRKLGDLLNYEQPTKYIVKSADYDNSFQTPVLTAGQSFILGYTNETDGIKNANDENPVIIFDDFTTSSHYVDFPFKIKSSAMKILSVANDDLNPIFVFNALKNIKYTPANHERHWISIFSNFDIWLPEKAEQTAIGNFFLQLDSLITLHQRKLENAKNLKKGLLQKMFPKNGESVPEIRFPEFTDAWEQRKLGDIGTDFVGGGTPDTKNKEFWNGQIPWVQSSDVKEDNVLDITPRKFISEQGLKNSATKLVPKNSIAIVTRVGVGKVLLVPFEYTTSQDFLSISNLNIDKLFAIYSIYQLLKLESKKVQGTSIKGITKVDLLEKVIKIPTDTAEQTAIGNLFRQLDSLITLHQRKLEHLKQLKKSLLQQMFV